ncbi:MAG TPA: amidohydrolase [Vicinamibacteria bacterium]
MTLVLSMLLAAAAAGVSPAVKARDARLAAAVDKLSPAMIAARQRLHQNPELGNREQETAKLVAEHLTALGLEVKTGIAYTGIVATLRGGKPGPLVAVRADMDALPVTEDTPLPFKSTKRTSYLGQEVGVSHACGHDIHVAVQMGVAAVLAGMRAELPGEVQFLFQPAEEGPPPGEEGGAALMLKEGIWKERKPKAVFSLHAAGSVPVGQINYSPGPAMAAADGIVIVIKGRQAHGARPELSVDPIVVASEVVMAFQTIRSRSTPPLAASVVTIGMFRGGQRRNIIPAEVELQGTVRTYDPKVQDTIERRMREILEGITKAYGASYTLEYNRQYPATVNEVGLTNATLPSLRRVVGETGVKLVEPLSGSEDFSFFSNETPGFMFFLGSLKEGTTSGDHHTPTFLADDSAVPVGIRAMSTVLLDYLARESGQR